MNRFWRLFLNVSIGGEVESILARHVGTELEFHFHVGWLNSGVSVLVEMVWEKVVVFGVGDLETVSVESGVWSRSFLGGFEEISVLHFKID